VFIFVLLGKNIGRQTTTRMVTLISEFL